MDTGKRRGSLVLFRAVSATDQAPDDDRTQVVDAIALVCERFERHKQQRADIAERRREFARKYGPRRDRRRRPPSIQSKPSRIDQWRWDHDQLTDDERVHVAQLVAMAVGLQRKRIRAWYSDLTGVRHLLAWSRRGDHGDRARFLHELAVLERITDTPAQDDQDAIRAPQLPVHADAERWQRRSPCLSHHDPETTVRTLLNAPGAPQLPSAAAAA